MFRHNFLSIKKRKVGSRLSILIFVSALSSSFLNFVLSAEMLQISHEPYFAHNHLPLQFLTPTLKVFALITFLGKYYYNLRCGNN